MSLTRSGVHGYGRAPMGGATREARIVRQGQARAGLLIGALLLALGIGVAYAGSGVHPKTKRVSVGSAGSEGDGPSYDSSVSADGRFVAFDSNASNLVGNDTNGFEDVFVRDRKTGKTKRVSVSSSGTEGGDSSFEPWISADGRFVAFTSQATNL